MESFHQILTQIGRGQLVEVATERLAELVEAITDPELRAADAEGEITLKLKVKLERDTGAVKISPTLEIKKPKQPLDRALFFVTPDGDLVRDNPRQGHLFGKGENVEALDRKRD